MRYVRLDSQAGAHAAYYQPLLQIMSRVLERLAITHTVDEKDRSCDKGPPDGHRYAGGGV